MSAPLERAPCGACGAFDAAVLFRSGDRVVPVPGESFPVGRCRRCGHVYLTERPPESEIGRYYPAGYEPHRHCDKPSDRKGSRRHRFIRLRPPFRILDVGCGSGYDLLRFRDQGCEVYGIEPDPEAAAEARKNGVVVSHSSVEAAAFPAGHFHRVTMNYSLEHLYDPRAAMANVRRMLRPEGTVYLLFPTADGAICRIFREDWYHLDVPRHLQFFTHESFRRLCADVGLAIVYRGNRSGGRGFRRSLGYWGEWSAAGRVARKAARMAPFSQISKVVLRYLVDGLRHGDVAEYLVRRAPDRPAT